MTKEIEKIMALRENLDGAEKKKLADALNVIGDTFKAMVISTKGSFFGNGAEMVLLEEAKSALVTIKALADKSGVEFPAFDTDEKVVTYVIKYGTEIVKTR